MRFKNELERNITIKLGYANAKIFKAVEGAVPGPGNFRQARGEREGAGPVDRCLWFGVFRSVLVDYFVFSFFLCMLWCLRSVDEFVFAVGRCLFRG